MEKQKSPEKIAYFQKKNPTGQLDCFHPKVPEKWIWLVVSTHLKNISQNGNLPQIGVKIKHIWNHNLVNECHLKRDHFSRKIVFQPAFFRGYVTPWKINMEHNNGGLEDDFPFQIGDF